jgi:hypothetical protein
VSTVVWSAFAFFCAVLVTGTIGLAATGLGTWRQLKRTGQVGAGSVGEILARLEGLEARVASLERSSTELQASAQRLAVSVRRVRVLVAAFQDATAVVRVALPFLRRR